MFELGPPQRIKVRLDDEDIAMGTGKGVCWTLQTGCEVIPKRRYGALTRRDSKCKFALWLKMLSERNVNAFMYVCMYLMNSLIINWV